MGNITRSAIEDVMYLMDENIFDIVRIKLNPREQSIIKLRHGYEDGTCWTYSKIAHKIKRIDNRSDKPLTPRQINKFYFQTLLKIKWCLYEND